MKITVLLILLSFPLALRGEDPQKGTIGEPGRSLTRFSHLPPKYENSSVSNVIKFNPLALLLGRYSFAYERTLGERTSLELELAIVNFRLETFEDALFEWTGFRVSPQFRYYFSSSRQAPKGSYVSPFLEYSDYRFSISYLDDFRGSASASLFGMGVNLGRQWIAGDVFAIDMYLGAGLNFGGLTGQVVLINPSDPSRKATIRAPESLSPPFLFNFGFALGFGF